LEGVKSGGISNPQSQKTLFEAKQALLSHLQKEDRELYPKLLLAAKKDPNIGSLISIFTKDMEKISSFALEFFDKYKNGGESLEFAKDFGRLVSELTIRIRREEEKLYAAYDNLA